MLFFYRLMNYLGYFLVMIIFVTIAIANARKKSAWVFYAIGAIMQLMALRGTQKTASFYGYNTSMDWVVYFGLLIIAAILIVKRKNASDRCNCDVEIKHVSAKVAEEDSIETESPNPVEVTLTCSFCHRDLLPDAEFCPHCGQKVEGKLGKTIEAVNDVDAPFPNNNESDVQPEPSIVPTPLVSQEHSDTAPPPKKAKYCKRCGGLIDTQAKKCSKCGKQYFRVKKSFLVLVLIIVLFGSIGLNIGQHLHSKSIISDLENTVLSQKLTLSSKQAALARYENDFNLLAQGNIGYASNNFKADQSIIVLHKNETKKFKLTASWSGNISIENSHRTVADVSFDNDYWLSSTSMTVEPRTLGTTVVTFGNDVDSRTFRILIIVTEAPPKMSLSEYLESRD